MFVSRIRVDEVSNTYEKALTGHGALPEVPIHASPTCIRLVCRQVGSVDSLEYREVRKSELPLEQQKFVEVELYAAGLNFKICSYLSHHFFMLNGEGHQYLSSSFRLVVAQF